RGARPATAGVRPRTGACARRPRGRRRRQSGRSRPPTRTARQGSGDPAWMPARGRTGGSRFDLEIDDLFFAPLELSLELAFDFGREVVGDGAAALRDLLRHVVAVEVDLFFERDLDLEMDLVALVVDEFLDPADRVP